jgi:UDP:flavonoid glycosyltransferase YjiC (YdhE family)
VPGEFAPLFEIARGLMARGHQVTVLTGSGFRSSVERAGLSFAPLTGTADFDPRSVHAQPARAALPPGPAQLSWDLVNVFINRMPDQHAALQELLHREPGQYLVANTLFLGAWPAWLGAPGARPARWVAASAVPLALSSEDTTFLGPVPVGPGEDPKIANRAANALFESATQTVSDRAGDVLRGLGARPPQAPFLDAMYTMPDQTAVLSVPGFEFERSDLPGNVHLAGILPAPVGPDWTPPGWWDELDGSRPVVVVTQGTIANEDYSQLIEPAMAGLADMDVTVVAALGRDLGALSARIPANARVAEYLPFGALTFMR